MFALTVLQPFSPMIEMGCLDALPAPARNGDAAWAARHAPLSGRRWRLAQLPAIGGLIPHARR